MKKFLSVILTLALAATLSSCGNDKEEQTSAFTTTTTAAETTTTAEITTAASEAEATEQSGGLQLQEAPEDDDIGWGDFEVIE